VRLLPAYYPIQDTVAQVLPFLSTSHRRQLSLWIAGVLEAQDGYETAVVLALQEATQAAGHAVAANTIRQDLRELFRDAGATDQWANRELELPRCFPALLAYVLTLLVPQELALAIDVTHFQDRVAAIAVSVVYRARAIPVAWAIRGAAARGRWLPQILALLALVRPVVPAGLRVLVLADEGLFSPTLVRTVQAYGWLPLVRGHLTTVVTLAASGRQCAAGTLVPGPGHAWVGRVVLFKTVAAQLRVTLLVVWGSDHEEAWVLVTSAAPRAVGVYWYRLRAWIECSFRDLKALGWQWERTQRRDCTRVAWHWLVLAFASIVALAAGTRAEEAERQGVPRAQVIRPPLPPPPQTGQRRVSTFTRGCAIAHRQLVHGRLPLTDWLLQEAWPEPPQTLHITYADEPSTPLPQ